MFNGINPGNLSVYWRWRRERGEKGGRPAPPPRRGAFRSAARPKQRATLPARIFFVSLLPGNGVFRTPFPSWQRMRPDSATAFRNPLSGPAAEMGRESFSRPGTGNRSFCETDARLWRPERNFRVHVGNDRSFVRARL